MSNEHKPDYSVIPPTGAFEQNQATGKGAEWPSKFVLPQGPSGTFSKGGWTEGNEGFIQQTFLGASIRNFNVAGGFGDSSSNLSVSLVEDEYNKSDGTFLGLGDDVYHSGNGDKFVPPPVGTPVFFKFGKNWATVEQAYRRAIDEAYGLTDLEAFKQIREKRDEKWTTKDKNGKTLKEYELEQPSGAFSITPFEVSGEFPNNRQKFYLRKNEKDLIYSDPQDPRDDKRTWVDRSFLYTHDDRDRGYEHFTFGGILQSVSETRGANGNPVQTVQVTDPREILGNCSLILNDYAGTTFNNKNLFNLYGFLEYDPSRELQKRLDNESEFKWVIEKQVSQTGQVRYFGRDKDKKSVEKIIFPIPTDQENELQLNPSPDYWDVYKFPQTVISVANVGKVFTRESIDPEFGVEGVEKFPKFFPITGEGFSRRTEQGIPWYRVSQALGALFEQYGKLPEEYSEAGFGGTIDFRGFNYVVDFGGIPLEKIPNTYLLKYNQIDLLSLVQELCDALSHDLFVSLLPVIDPLTNLTDAQDEKAAIMNAAFAKNSYWTRRARDFDFGSEKYNKAMSNIIHGVIRVDAIDRSKQPSYGSIQSYINQLENKGIYVENRNLGFELSNVTTDKFVAGAQEVEMYYFSTYKDRDSLEARKQAAGVPNNLQNINEKQWTLEASLKQQVLPFYGFLGKNALSIPRGFGAYQQIMLDASSLDAFGVGNYYVATEMELRHAIKGYDEWKDFICRYNDSYIEEVGQNKAFYKELARTTSKDIEGLGGDLSEPLGTCITPTFEGEPDIISTGVPKSSCDGANETFIETTPAQLLNREFGVSVPRCVFNSDKNFMNDDNTPASPCSPPYGYPLYYKRAQNIGISKAGVAKVANAVSRVRSQIETIKNYASSDPMNNVYKANFEALEEETRMLEELASYAGEDAIDGLKETINCIYEQQRAITATENELIKASGNIAKVDNVLRTANALSVNLSNLSRKGERNARKIHEFVAKIAQENLGKKFLVKIPRFCNVNYSEIPELKTYFGFQGYRQDENGQDILDEPIYGNVTDAIREIYKGPFGFKPLPVNASGQSLIESQSHIFKMNQIRQDQLINKSWSYERFLYKDNFIGSKNPDTADLTYGYGALKGNYNPLSEKWAFNYVPEPQGGFLNFALYPRNLSLSQVESRSIPDSKLSPAAQYNFVPKDLSNFVSDNGRIECYVRFDNSQYLDFKGIGADSITQEVVQGNTLIPDVLSELDNVNTDEPESLQDHVKRESGPDKKPTAVAYVKCSVEPRLFMPPKSEETPALVFGRDIRYVPNFAPPKVIEGTDDLGCPTYKCVKPFAEPIFEPSSRYKEVAANIGYERVLQPQDFMFDDKTFQIQTTFGDPNRLIKGGGLDSTIIRHVEYARRYDKETDSFIIDTEEQNLDSDHVYALITLPGVVSTNVNQRFMDAEILSRGTASIKNIMTQDVVRGPEGFELPAQLVNKKVPIDCSDFTFEDIEAAERAQRESVESLIRADRESIATSAGSPVFPNLVALPLMSTERCYGPWRSAANIDGSKDRYTDIGGKVEFVKNEDLAPWNYAGYQLMNEAGVLEAEFSNSLLLFSERGGFVFPSTPAGISIGKALQDGGPLVTSVSIDVSQAGVKTTVKMDLYTSRFGRLQKQKEDAIAQIVRERQKIIDTNNEMVRKGLIRNATSSTANSIKSAFAGANNLINDFSNLNAEPPEPRRRLRLRTIRRLARNDEGGEETITETGLENVDSTNEKDLDGYLSSAQARQREYATAEEEGQIPYDESNNPQMPSKSPVNTKSISDQIAPLGIPPQILPDDIA